MQGRQKNPVLGGILMKCYSITYWLEPLRGNVTYRRFCRADSVQEAKARALEWLEGMLDYHTVSRRLIWVEEDV